MTTVILAEGLGKKYLISHQPKERYTALRDVLAARAKRLSKGILRPFSGSANAAAKTREEFWALKDLSFEVQEGDRVGIIGRNGAGKSTLLKILSRITDPSEGRVKIKGRVASLLEVGTGFHPELTGRENIYLNGAILGMSRAYIKRKFDEIVSFSEVEKFLDTPVKRYSSGMYVRLAFAVAAHLETEILVVDEVLAVGDAQFQKKCLGVMGDVGNSGRTLLFVSHNMATITSLCRKAILLESGRIKKIGPTSDVVMNYYTNEMISPALIDFSSAKRFVGDRHARLLSGAVRNSKREYSIEINISESVEIEMQYEVIDGNDSIFEPNFHFYTADGVCAFVSSDTARRSHKKGVYVARCHIPANFLNEGSYFVGLALTSFEKGVVVHFFERSALSFNVYDPIHGVPTRSDWAGPILGVVRPLLTWSTERLS